MTAQSQDSKKTFYIVLIIILILLNGFFAYNHYKARQANIKLEAEKKALLTELDSIDTQLAHFSMRLDSMRGINMGLDSQMVSIKKELEGKRAQIEILLRNKKELDKARALINSLKSDNQIYFAKIDSMHQVIAALSDTVRVKEAVNKQLQSEKSQLLTEKTLLTRKVELSSLLIPENVQATGVFMKSSDREVPTTKAKKAQKLKVCFDVPENRGVDAGDKTILVRILNPQGATIAVESSGSGMFTTETGEQQQYTTLAKFNYNNTKQNVCLHWSQTQAFGAGSYKVFFYQDGHELGNSEFELK